MEGLCYKGGDPALGWAILTAVDIVIHGYSASGDVMEMNQDKLSQQEKEEAEDLAGEWINKQSPLSYFPSRFGF